MKMKRGVEHQLIVHDFAHPGKWHYMVTQIRCSSFDLRMGPFVGEDVEQELMVDVSRINETR